MSDIFRDYSFGGWLRYYRVKREIGLREMCRVSGVNASNYCNMERSEIDPPKEKAKIKKIADALKLTESEAEILYSTAYQHHLKKLKDKFNSCAK